MEPTSLKTCAVCYQPRPLDWFRRRFRGSHLRDHRCRPCYNAAARSYRAIRRQKELRQFIQRLHRARTNREVHVLVAAMRQRFRGMKRLIQTWRDAVEAVQPSFALKNYQAMVNVFRVADGYKISQLRSQSRSHPSLPDEFG